MKTGKKMVEQIKKSYPGSTYRTGREICKKLHDAYLSVVEALNHAGYAQNAYIRIHWIDSENITKENVAQIFRGIHGIIVPGGFGNRGIEGMITAAEYARKNRIPYFGICLGMQIAVIEYARNEAGLPEAHSGNLMSSEGTRLLILCRDKVMILIREAHSDLEITLV